MLFAYFAPEVVLPIASVFAAAFGFIVMVGRAPFRYVAQWFRATRKRVKREPVKPDDQPEA